VPRAARWPSGNVDRLLPAATPRRVWLRAGGEPECWEAERDMAILVVCRGCRARFKVSDQFAGRTGPCPKCKTPIRIPEKTEEVKIHEPDAAGPGAAARAAIKPIAFEETKWNPVAAAGIVAAAVLALLVTWLGGRAELFEKNILLRGLGLLIISPPLVVAGYTFLRSSEDLAPYRGRRLYVRAAICALVYIALWWVFGLLAERVLTGELWMWACLATPFFLVGGLAAMVSLDLDFGNGVFHYCFYVLVTILLRQVGGMGWVWELGGPTAGLG